MAEAVDAESNWGRRLLMGGGIAVVVVVAVLLASAAVPRWWAQHIGNRVDGSITQGVWVRPWTRELSPARTRAHA